MQNTTIRPTQSAICEFCNCVYVRRVEDRQRRYCSKKCKGKDITARKTVEQQCESCGGMFRLSCSQARYRPRRNCSRQCRQRRAVPSANARAVLALHDTGTMNARIIAQQIGLSYGYVRAICIRYRRTDEQLADMQAKRLQRQFRICGACGKQRQEATLCCTACATRQRNAELKHEVFEAYGHQCQCCGLTDMEFLTLDHVNNDGAAHRREVGTGNRIYREVKRLGFPKDRFQLLCWNCNCAKQHFGECPHTKSGRKNATGTAGK